MRTPKSPQICIRGGVTYTEPLTGVTLKAHGIGALIQKTAKHRFANGIVPAAGWLDAFYDNLCNQNPRLPCVDVIIGDHPLVIQGRAAWQSLHDYALAYPEPPTEQDKVNALEWLASWRLTIPTSGGCKCRDHWKEVETANPFDLSGRAAFYNSTVRNHDIVNARLGKPLQAQFFVIP